MKKKFDQWSLKLWGFLHSKPNFKQKKESVWITPSSEFGQALGTLAGLSTPFLVLGYWLYGMVFWRALLAGLFTSFTIMWIVLFVVNVLLWRKRRLS